MSRVGELKRLKRVILPKCFQESSEKGKCLGYSLYNDDEPIEKCKRCSYCTSSYDK